MSVKSAMTEILGFSQSYQWYTGQPFEFPVSDPTFKPQQEFLAGYKGPLNCQARFTFGGDVTQWKDANYIGYEGHVAHSLSRDRRDITRLIFNVSGESRAVATWKSDIESVVEILLKKYPNLQELYLQPVIGGVDDTPGVRAIRNHPTIVEAINAVVSDSAPGPLRLGAVIKLDNEDFSDRIGHLSAAGAQKARGLAFKFYGISFSVFDLLAAPGPFAEYADKMMLYGQFVGSWDVDVTWYAPGGGQRQSKAEWHFAWVLGGRGVQDVLFGVSAPSHKFGTTLRCYDKALDAWHVSWMQPYGGEFVQLVGRQVEDQIVQDVVGSDKRRRERWVFTQITPDSFLWFGEVSFDDGATWFREQEMWATRRGPSKT